MLPLLVRYTSVIHSVEVILMTIYWIRDNNGVQRVTCNMGHKCIEGGWMRVVDVDTYE